jgi:hypothetical protein
MSFRFQSPALFAAPLLAGLMFAGHARAAECTDNEDCPKGTACEVVASSDCVTPDIDCVDGSDCPAPEPCESEEIKACVPGPCDTDADCGDGLVCFEQTYEECSGGGGSTDCPPDEECVAPEMEPAECTTHTDRFCAPPWVGGCEVDADCGAGFTCDEIESCGCTGSAGSAGDPGAGAGGASSEDPVPPEESDCSCEKTGEFYCHLTETECGTASDCPADFTCEANPNGGVCTSGPDGEEPTCTEPDPAKICMPPYWDLGYYGVDSYAAAESGSDNGGTVGGGGEEAPRGLPEPVSDSDDGNSESNSTDSDAGCAVAPVTGRGSLGGLGAMLGLLGLGLIARRRR